METKQLVNKFVSTEVSTQDQENAFQQILSQLKEGLIGLDVIVLSLGETLMNKDEMLRSRGMITLINLLMSKELFYFHN